MIRRLTLRKAEKEEKKEEGEEKDSETTPLKPTRTFYIVPHTSFNRTIKVLDLTGAITAPYPSEAFDDEVKKLTETSPPEPWILLTRTPHWYSKHYTITQRTIIDGQEKQEHVAEWDAGFFSASSNTFTFPPDSPHSSHEIKVKADNFIRFREMFVKDSVTYLWKPENALTARKFTLVRIIGERREEVARYWQGFQIKYGGVLVLDDAGIDDVVGVVTMVNILRKKRQKRAERSGGGGGGGGGS